MVPDDLPDAAIAAAPPPPRGERLVTAGPSHRSDARVDRESRDKRREITEGALLARSPPKQSAKRYCGLRLFSVELR